MPANARRRKAGQRRCPYRDAARAGTSAGWAVRRGGARGGSGPRRGKGYECVWVQHRPATVGDELDGLVIRRVVFIAAGGTGALVIGIVILIGSGANNPSSGCGAGPSAAGQPPMIQYYIQAAAAANLGPDGYAYLAGINHVESGFGSSMLPGVDSGTNPYGAAGPMQIGVDGQAGNTWGGVVGRIPASLAGGTSPPSVYNAADAIYGAALYLADSGAPGDWQNAVFSYNHAGWYVQQVTDYADSYMGSNGLAKLASDIASFYGGKQPPTLVGLTTSTATSTASPAPSIDGPSGQTSTTGQSSTSASATAGGAGRAGRVGGLRHGGRPGVRESVGAKPGPYAAADRYGRGLHGVGTDRRRGRRDDQLLAGAGNRAGARTRAREAAPARWWSSSPTGPTRASGSTSPRASSQRSALARPCRAGQQIGTFVGCIEIGWADGPGPSPRAADLHQDAVSLGLSNDPGAYPTGCGEDMNRLLVATHAPSGLQGSRIDGSGC